MQQHNCKWHTMLYAVSHRRHTVFDVACIISALATRTSRKSFRFSEATMTEITIKLEGPDLASRKTAAIEGWEWLIKNVQLKGANEHVLRVVAEAINRRLKETGQPVKRSA